MATKCSIHPMPPDPELSSERVLKGLPHVPEGHYRIEPTITYDDLNEEERGIYDDAYLNLKTKVIAQVRGYRTDAARIAFHRKFGHIISLAHTQHLRDLHSAQFEAATVDKNPTMLVWVGKQAGQTDLAVTEMGETAEFNVDPSLITVVRPTA